MFKNALFESVKVWIHDPDNASLPLYQRIQRAIKNLILEGLLEADRPLPASRNLAKSLNVSRDTVEAAYTQLHAEGFIERHTGKGSFVSKYISQFNQQKAHSNQKPKPLPLSRRGEKMYENGGMNDCSLPIPFLPGIPETRVFPLQLWERLERQTLKEYGTELLLHSHPQGTERLRKAIADYINLERGAKASADRILILTSSQQAMTICANVLMDSGESIFIENPVYQGAYKAFAATGLNCIPVPIDDHGICTNELFNNDQQCKAIYLTPSHQYPTGTTLTLGRRIEIIEWAKKENTWIIEDDYDSEFHYEGKPTACVQGLDPYERTIYIGTFTKSMFPGLRIGFMLLPKQLVAPMTAARSLMDGHNAPIAQLTLARFIESGHLGAHIKTMRSMYVQRRDVLVRLIDKHLSEFVIPQIPTGGMQMPCYLIQELPEKEIIEIAKKEGIYLLALSTLYHNHSPQFGFLMGFAAHAPRELEIAVKKLRKILVQMISYK